MALAAIFIMAALGFGYLCEPGKTPYSPYSDFVSEHLSTKAVLYDSIHAGRGIPFWRNDQFSGYAGLTNPQSLYTYPLHVLFYFLKPLEAVGPTFWLHFLGAGIAYYLVGAALELGALSRLLMAAAGMFSFKLIIATFAGWLPIIPGIVCFPLLFAAVLYLVRRPGLAGAIWLALAGALCVHTGHIQLFYYSVLFLLAYVAIQFLRRLRSGEYAATVRTCGYLAGGAILAVGMTAYLLAPLAAEAGLLSRSQSSYEFFLANHALAPRHLLTFFYPEALGTPLDRSYSGVELWEDVGYFGLLPLVLAGVGVWLGWRRKPTAYLAASFFVALLLCMDTPVERLLFAYLPGFKLFRCPGRFLFLASFFGIALAGIGLEEALARLAKAFPQRRKLWLALAVTLVGVVALEGGYYARHYLETVPARQIVPETGYRAQIASDGQVFRTMGLGRGVINYGWARPMGLQLATGNDSYNYKHYQTYFDILQWGQLVRDVPGAWCDLNSVNRADLVDALNVKYLVTAQRLDFTLDWQPMAVLRNQPAFVLYQGWLRADLYLYRNSHFLPRAFFADQVRAADGEDQLLPLIQKANLHTTAVVLGPARQAADGGPTSSSPSARDDVSINAAWDGHLALGTQAASEQFLVISEVWHPGWRARLDGRPLELHRTDYALLGAWVPAGDHKIELDFRPLNWELGLGISTGAGAALLALTCSWLLLMARRRRAP